MELWPFMPQRRLTESMEWLTDVIRCQGAEQRIALRDAPRHTYMLDHILGPSQFSRAKFLARAYSEEQIQVPVWNELTVVGRVNNGATSLVFDTSFASYREGGLVAVWESDLRYDVRTIVTLSETGLTLDSGVSILYSDAVVMPVRVATFAQALSATRANTDDVRVQARFLATEDQGIDLAGLVEGMTQINGHDVLLDRAVLIGEMREQFEREVEVLDAGMGTVWLGPQYTYPVEQSSVSWATRDRESTWKLRAWLHSRKGKLKGFWLPSWNNDFTLNTNIGPSDTQLVVDDQRYRGVHTGTRRIMVKLTDGQLKFLTVTACSLHSAGKERLSLSGATGFTATVAGVESISFLTFVRFNADRVEIRHTDARAATVVIPTFETPEPT